VADRHDAADGGVAVTAIEPAARLTGVTRRYRDGGGAPAPALEGVSLDLAPGAITVLAGRSGSGKTTLLNLLAALDRPDEGSVRVLGHDLSSLSDGALADLRRTRLGLVYQRFHFVEHLPVWQNVGRRLVPAGVPARERRERARAILAELDVEFAIDRLPGQLSGGEQQRVALARALCASPDLVIADEPTSNVDAATGALLIERFTRLRASGTTLIVATHDPALLALADAHHVLEHGRIAS
jgi:putative ABC transport system ATP-binding protein